MFKFYEQICQCFVHARSNITATKYIYVDTTRDIVHVYGFTALTMYTVQIYEISYRGKIKFHSVNTIRSFTEQYHFILCYADVIFVLSF